MPTEENNNLGTLLLSTVALGYLLTRYRLFRRFQGPLMVLLVGGTWLMNQPSSNHKPVKKSKSSAK